MDEAQVRVFLEEIVTMPDAEQAQELALSDRRLLLSPMAFHAISAMLREPAGDQRRAALATLQEFRTEVFERTMMGRDLEDPRLPRLVVAPDPERDRFAYWLDRIQQDTSGKNAPVGTGPHGAALRVLDLEQQHLTLLPRTMFGRADAAVIGELQAVLAGYHQVLEAGLPEGEFLSADDVLRRCAQVYESLGRASDARGQRDEAQEYYEQAAELHERLGDEHNAQGARDRQARVQLDAEGEVDTEMLRLQAAIDAGPPSSVAHVKLLVELAELYQRSGNDFDAAPVLERAQSAMAALGYGDPAGPRGRELAEALRNFAAAAREGDLAARAERMQELLLVRSLYGRIYTAWVQVFQGRQDYASAERYQALAAGLESDTINAEFSRVLSETLPELFGATGEADGDFSPVAHAVLSDMDWFSPGR